MPPKITPKNLSYDTTLPPFLQKLQNNYDRGLEGRDGRHESALLRARPKRARNAEDEAEDEPVYVDESGNVVEKGDLNREEELVTAKEDGDGAGGEEILESGKERTEKEKEKLAGIGGMKKRKIGKVIGSYDEKVDADAKEETGGLPKSTTSTSKKLPNPGTKKKAPSKNKKVKLSFGDDE